MTLRLHEPGATVLVGDVECLVLAVVVRGAAKHVEYNIGWWNEGQRHEEWVPAAELSDTGKMRLGFGNGE